VLNAECCYCGLGESWSAFETGIGLADEGLLAPAAGSALCDTGDNDAAFGMSGPVVIALSGFNR